MELEVLLRLAEIVAVAAAVYGGIRADMRGLRRDVDRHDRIIENLFGVTK